MIIGSVDVSKIVPFSAGTPANIYEQAGICSATGI